MPDTIDTIVPEGTPTDTLKQTQQTLFIVPEGTPTATQTTLIPSQYDYPTKLEQATPGMG